MVSHVRLFATPWTVYILPGYPVHGDSPGKNTGVGCRFLLHGVFLTQGLNLCLLHWQADCLPLFAIWEAPVYLKTLRNLPQESLTFFFFFALTFGKVSLVNCVWSWGASPSLLGSTHHCLSFLCFIYALGTTTSWLTAVLQSDTNSLIPSRCSYTHWNWIRMQFQW